MVPGLGVPSTDASDDFQQLVLPVSVLPGHTGELGRLGDDGAPIWRPGDGDATAAAELEQALVTKRSERAQDRVGVDAELSCEVARGWEPLPGLGLALRDGSSNLRGHLCVQIGWLERIHLDIQHDASDTSIITLRDQEAVVALNTHLPAHPDPGEVEASEALIREARQRARRRRLRYAITTVVLLAAATGGGLAVRGGGSSSPPLGASQAQHPAPGAIPAPRAARGWPGTQVGGDGNSFGIIVADPRRPRTMYAASLDAGVFKSADAGRTWRMLPFPRGGEGDRVDVLAITPRGPRVLYAGGSDGVFASADGGKTWHAANNGLVPDPFERKIRRYEGWIFSLTVHPLDPDLMYASGVTSSWRSTDGGDHWTRFEVGRLDIAIDPQDPRVLYAPNQQWRYRDQQLVATPVVPAEDSVVKSTDGGRSWSPSGLRLPGVDVDKLVVNAGDPRVVFATTPNDRGVEVLHRSTDGGASWQPTSLRSSWPGQVSPDPQDPDTVYVQTWPTNNDGDSRILKSTDGGATWWPLFRQADMRAHEPGLLPLDPAQPSALYVGSDAGLLKSTDAGATWHRMGSGVASPVSSIAVDPRRPGIAYAGLNQGGVVKKVRGRWYPINHGLGETGVDDVAVDPYRSGVVYAAAHTGLFRTTDGGQNWRRVLDPRRHWDPASRRFGADAVAVAGPTTVYATISRGGRWFLWKSVDRGASWRRLARHTLSTGADLWRNVDRGANSRSLGRTTLLTGDGHPLAAGSSDPETVYVAGRSGLATSTDGGATWHDAGLVGTRITAIAVHPQLADTVYAGTAAGLFTTTNAGQTWQRAGEDLAQAHVTAVATDPEQGGRVYAATMNEVFWSDNSGESWNRFDTRIPPRTFNDLAAARTGMIYAGSSNGGGIVQLRTPAQAPRP